MRNLRPGILFLVLSQLTGCGNQVVGWPITDVIAPTVSSTAPARAATNVAVNMALTASFSEVMDPATITTNTFVLMAGTTPVPGTLSYVGVTAVFAPVADLAATTTYTATIRGSVSDLAGNAMGADYSWSFTTGPMRKRQPPTVSFTYPSDAATGVALDGNIVAVFSETIDPRTMTTATFTLQNGTSPILGVVTPIGATAIFDAARDLEPGTLYTATITTGVTDLAGNALAANYVWTFTTGAIRDPGAPTVILTSPLDRASNVPIDARVNATFSEAMNPSTLTTATFRLTGPGAAPISGTVLYNVFNVVGTFTPNADLLPNTLYTATVTTAATDLAGHGLVVDHVWSFSTGNVRSGVAPVELGSLGTFVAVAGAGLTNSNSSGTTTLNGDVGLSPTGTCMGDGSPCTLVNPVINGTLFANDPAGVAAQAKVDLTAAYDDAMARPVGTIVNDISGMVLAPGVYTSASTMSIAVGGTVTLDAQGDANAVWIFQIGSSLTVNNNAQVILVNGASAKNVFFAAVASSTLGSNVSFQGSIMTGESNAVGTDSTVVGRLLCTTGAISLLSNTITLPPL